MLLPVVAAAPKSGDEAEAACSTGLEVVVHERPEHEDAPEAEHDARDRGEHLDERPTAPRTPRGASSSGRARWRSRSARPGSMKATLRGIPRYGPCGLTLSGRGLRLSPSVPTHWDREWYPPFQAFRLRLVELLDDLLPRLEADPTFRHFLLDGQMAVVDDYLEVRPEAEARLRRWPRAAGWPWGPGTCCPTSSSSRARRSSATCSWGCAGGGVRRGHGRRLPARHVRPRGPDAPDPAPAGFEHAVVWRGVPAAVDRTGFWWGPPTARRCGPSTCPGLRQRRPRAPTTPRRCSRRVDGSRGQLGASSSARPAAVDERRRPPAAPALAGPGRGRGQRRPGRLSARVIVAAPSTSPPPPPTACPRGQGELRSGAGPTC